MECREGAVLCVLCTHEKAINQMRGILCAFSGSVSDVEGLCEKLFPSFGIHGLHHIDFSCRGSIHEWRENRRVNRAVWDPTPAAD